jgi:hypothetical protein
VRHLIPALVVTAAVFSTAHAQPTKTSPFSNKSFGDGGGYKHPDPAVGQFFETKPQETADAKPKDSPKEKPEAKPERQAPPKSEAKAPETSSRPRPRPFSPIAAKAETPKPAEPARTAQAAQAAAAEGSSLDSASEDARADYEARLFGAAPSPRRQELADPRFPATTDTVAPVSLGEGMLFVSLELDSQEAGTLRDAVAGLGSAAAFRPDARFQPLPGSGGSVRISGWLPASRLGDAIARPGVKRVEVERGSRPAADIRVKSDYLLKLRVSDAARSEESVAESVRVLTSVAGFELDRVLGIETIPGGGSTALVSGKMPVSQLGRALGLPGVIKISSALPAEKPAAEAPVAPVKKEGFLKFVLGRGLWLVLLTALIALPTVGGVVKKGLSVFVPYR